MTTKQFSKLVELVDSLIYQKEGEHLKSVEREILEQILMGKALKELQVKELTNSTIRRHYIPNLWKRLSNAFGERIRKENVLEKLETLQLQRNLSRATSRRRVSEEAQNEHNGHTVANGFKTDQNNQECCIAADNIGDESIRNENFNQTNTCSVCSGKSSINRRLRQLFKVNRSYNREASNTSPNSIATHFQSSKYTFRSDNSEKTNSNSYGWHTYTKFLKVGLPLVIVMFGAWVYGLSWVADWYGAKSHLTGQLPQAEFFFKIALALDPRFSAETHYNLGAVHEDQRNYTSAHAEYQKAIEGGLVEAYSNQARLYILEGNYDPAVTLLEIGLPLVKNKNVDTKYSFYKNRGWVRLLQGRLEEAEVDLEQAIALKDDSASAHCLMAQLMEHEGEKKKALSEWENCLRYVQSRFPEQDKWMEIAQQRLKPTTGEK